MKRLFVIFCCFFCGCIAINTPEDFVYKEIYAGEFTLATWQKVTNPQGVYKIYIEGDGYAFNARGQVTRDPTPKSTFVRALAFGDANENVVYLARPCQYVKGLICSARHWTTARFAPEIINAEYEAIKQIAREKPVVLVGFSGGAQVAGLVAASKTGLNVKKIITIAGNLDHFAWTEYHHLPPLDESMNLESYREQFAKISQLHYVGSDDEVIVPRLVKEFVKDDGWVIDVLGATHNFGWESIYREIWNER